MYSNDLVHEVASCKYILPNKSFYAEFISLKNSFVSLNKCTLRRKQVIVLTWMTQENFQSTFLRVFDTVFELLSSQPVFGQ